MLDKIVRRGEEKEREREREREGEERRGEERERREREDRADLKEKKRHSILKMKSLQHQHFPRGPPPQYYTGRTQLNFTVRMGRGVFCVVWP